VRRDREWLGLAAAAGLWIAIEVAFAYHGWSAVTRYLLEPAAVPVVLAGGAVGRLLAWEPQITAARAGALVRGALRWAAVAVAAGLVATLIPTARPV
jgi:hypothetical protein